MTENSKTYIEPFGHCSVAGIVLQTPRHPSSARFHELLKEIGKLHDAKQQSYGRPGDPLANIRASEEWGYPGWVGAMMRATDKVRRLQSFAQTGSLNFESAEDNLKDIAVYALAALVLLEESRK